jgi:hypothetical protein
VLRITVHPDSESSILVLEGRLEAPWIPELEKAMAQPGFTLNTGSVTIDLCGVTAMDAAGEAILQALYQRGATLRCADLMNQFFLERMAAGTANPSQAISRPCHTAEEERT